MRPSAGALPILQEYLEGIEAEWQQQGEAYQHLNVKDSLLQDEKDG